MTRIEQKKQALANLREREAAGMKPVAYEFATTTEDLEQDIADARALWAVRVLDACAERNSSKLSPSTAPVAKPENVLGWTTFVFGQEYDGPTPDAARHVAALVVLPSLPADVRAKLGECP